MSELCTIVCDASFCPDYRVGGWAAWVVYNDQRIKQWAAFRDLCRNSGECEIKAALNGLHLARLHFAEASRFHFVIDCKEAIRHLENPRSPWRDQIKALAGEAQITVRHVRGHTRSDEARSWVNRWCDEKARAAMRQARKERRRQ